MILAIDPGKDKCGLAIVDEKSKVLEQKVCLRKDLLSLVNFYAHKFKVVAILVGRGTFHKEIEKDLSHLNLEIPIIFIAERSSSLEARKRYWKENPPPGFWKLFPTSFRLPPRPIDDYAAIILAERYYLSKK